LAPLTLTYLAFSVVLNHRDFLLSGNDEAEGEEPAYWHDHEHRGLYFAAKCEVELER
jgi:hypothetical protein